MCALRSAKLRSAALTTVAPNRLNVVDCGLPKARRNGGAAGHIVRACEPRPDLALVSAGWEGQ